MTKIKNTDDSLCWRGCGVKGTLLHCWWECKVYNCFANQYSVFSENWKSIYLKTQQYHSWAYTQRMLNHTKDICPTMFIAALFIIARTWEQPRCPSTEEWIRQMWYIYIEEYSSVVKKKKKWHLEICRQMNRTRKRKKKNILNEVTQNQKD